MYSMKDNLPPHTPHESYKLFNVSLDGIYGIKDFEHLNDYDFVYVAYMILLRRLPDTEGELYYLLRIRSGVTKEHILIDMMKSDEAKNVGVHIRWLKSYELLEWFLNIPIFGQIISFFIFSMTIKDHLKALRAIENRVYRIMRSIESDQSK